MYNKVSKNLSSIKNKVKKFKAVVFLNELTHATLANLADKLAI